MNKCQKCKNCTCNNYQQENWWIYRLKEMDGLKNSSDRFYFFCLDKTY